MFIGFGDEISFSPEELNKLITLGDKIEKAIEEGKLSSALSTDIDSFSGPLYFGDFGVSFFTRLRKIVTAPFKRAAGIVTQTVKALSKGNILKAISITNPIYAIAKLTSDNPHLLNVAAMTMPWSITAISDNKLRKKAALGYAAAAVIATGIGLAGAAGGAAGAATVATPAAVAAPVVAAAAPSTLATIGTAVGITGGVVGLAKQTGLLPSPAGVQPPSYEEIPPVEEAGMFSGSNLPLFLILGTAFGIAGIIYTRKR